MTAGQQRLPERLPLLDALLAEWAPPGRPLEGVTALLVQHQTGSIVPMVRTLVALGLDLARTFFVDIPYSTHTAVHEALRTEGVPAANFADADYRLDDSLASYQLHRVGRLLDAVRDRVSSDALTLVLDDGAYVLEALCESSPLPGRMAVVEQTVFGMRKVRENRKITALSSDVALVDVADSRPKKTTEAAFLGGSIVGTLARREFVVDRLRHGTTLLLGYGAIGRAVARSLCVDIGVPARSVTVGDVSDAARALARRDGFKTWLRRPGSSFDVVIGCSGRSSFRPDDVQFVAEDAVLASASSGTVEFSRDAVFALCAEADPRCFVYGSIPLSARSLHDDLRIRLFDRDVVLLNGGYPVDFDGTVNGAAGDRIQLTRALMVGGALQALSARPGVHSLADGFVDWIERRFRDLVMPSPT